MSMFIIIVFINSMNLHILLRKEISWLSSYHNQQKVIAILGGFLSYEVFLCFRNRQCDFKSKGILCRSTIGNSISLQVDECWRL
jgi:hypothetical protein